MTRKTHASADPDAPETLENLLKGVEAAAKARAAAQAEFDAENNLPDYQQSLNGDLGVKASNERVEQAEKDLATSLQKATEAAAIFAAEILDLASDEKNSVRLHCNGEAFIPLDRNKRDLKTIADLLSSVTHASIANPDAVREINRLLDHASARRITEEMDMGTYHERAAKLFGRIKQESAETAKIFHDLLEESMVSGRGVQSVLPALCKRSAKIRQLAEKLPAGDTLRLHLLNLGDFAARFRDFTSAGERQLDGFGKIFSSESAIDDFKDSTREICRRIEKTGLFASAWTLLAGILGGAAAAWILMFLDTNMMLKNWFLQITATSALAMYGLSVLFGRQARTAFMEDIRTALLQRARAHFPGTGPADAVFAFPKTLFAGNAGLLADTQSAKSQRVAPAPSFSKTERDANECERRLRLLGANAVALGLLVAVLLAVSLFGKTLDWNSTLSFIARDATGQPCKVLQGRVLFANGDSYFVSGADSADKAVHVTELRKQGLEVAVPSDRAKAMRNCLEPQQEKADELPAAVSAAAAQIADGLRARPNTAGIQPLVMPVLIESAAANPAAPGELTFVTNVLTAGKLVSLPFAMLPLFPEPVTGFSEEIYAEDGAPGLTSPMEAFHFGQAADHLDDPAIKTGGTLISRMGIAMQACMMATANAYGGAGNVPDHAKLKLEVLGFASHTGFGESLNLALAEGRRMAVIRKLRESARPELIVIVKEPASMADLAGIPENLDKIKNSFRFEDYGTMEGKLGAWMKLHSGVGDPANEAFARSVVIKFENDAMKNCGKGPEQAANLP